MFLALSIAEVDFQCLITSQSIGERHSGEQPHCRRSTCNTQRAVAGTYPAGREPGGMRVLLKTVHHPCVCQGMTSEVCWLPLVLQQLAIEGFVAADTHAVPSLR